MGFGNRTEEEKRETLARAKAARGARNAARKASTLRRDFLDADLWLDLARERGLRLPPWGEPATVGNVRRFARKAGWTQSQFEEWAGCGITQFVANNLWPLRAIAGVILEIQKEDTA